MTEDTETGKKSKRVLFHSLAACWSDFCRSFFMDWEVQRL
ncbi:hypothetical protein HSIEG1_1507 [Enterococcus sp. HSIEG1]|nr:hypothetical protein HSIEG1_1507 [Enterococcus sp. HSIEG1]OJG47628.1 hypothetical protein RV03_GL001982 [Enterococcus gallinarum]